MEGMNLKSLAFFAFIFCSSISAAETATLEFWPSGMNDLDCPLTYEIEPKPKWTEDGEPPLTIKELNLAFNDFAGENYPENALSILSYSLLYNNFLLGGDVGWIYFISYRIAEKNEPRRVLTDQFGMNVGRALITMNGTVLDVKCDTP